jgi:hypothetical protein
LWSDLPAPWNLWAADPRAPTRIQYVDPVLTLLIRGLVLLVVLGLLALIVRNTRRR